MADITPDNETSKFYHLWQRRIDAAKALGLDISKPDPKGIVTKLDELFISSLAKKPDLTLEELVINIQNKTGHKKTVLDVINEELKELRQL